VALNTCRSRLGAGRGYLCIAGRGRAPAVAAGAASGGLNDHDIGIKN